MRLRHHDELLKATGGRRSSSIDEWSLFASWPVVGIFGDDVRRRVVGAKSSHPLI
jgi:hypothetical protein